MEDFFHVKHSFNSGDLITLMAGLRKLWMDTGKKVKIFQRIGLPAYYYEGAVHSITNAEGHGVCMNQEMFDKLKPLVEAQEYIESFEVFNGERCDYDIDLTRADKFTPMPAGHIHHYPVALFPELACDLSEPWLKIESDIFFHLGNILNKLIVNRTERYQNPYITYFFLQKYAGKISFLGTYAEYENFCTTWKIDKESMPYIILPDFQYLLNNAYFARGFIGNQSFLWHCWDALKLPRILELNAVFPNTFPTGKNGYAFYRQSAVEFYVDKLMNE